MIMGCCRRGLLSLVDDADTQCHWGGSIYSDDIAGVAMAGCEVETGVTTPQSDHGSLSEQSMQIAAMSVLVEAERASLSPDVDITLTAEAVTPDVHLSLTVEAVQSVVATDCKCVTDTPARVATDYHQC